MKRILSAVALAACVLFPGNRGEAKDVGYYLETGDTSVVGQYTLKEGMIRVEKKGSPVNGMQVIIPAGVYNEAQTFTIRVSKVLKYNVPDFVLSPLISITGPREPANGLMIVKIPCAVPENAAAMIFFYDPADKFTQALIPGPEEAGFVTGMTKKFKDLVVVGQKIKRKPASRNNAAK